jgi:hypothetical protein
MDRKLQALVKLDVVSDVVWIDVRGSLTQDSRHALVHIIRRIRRMGIRSHIRADLSRALFVESAALSGLRNDLNAIDGGAAGVSLEMMPLGADRNGDSTRDSNGHVKESSETAFQTVEISGELVASIDPTGFRTLAKYSDEELLAASDSIFGMLDDPEAVKGSELLAQYDAIGVEIARREGNGKLQE